MENFIRAKFEDYNLGRAFQKALRTVSPIRCQDAVYIVFFDTEGCTGNDVILLTVYIIQIKVPLWWVMWPPYTIKKKCYLLRSCLVGSSVAGRGTPFRAQEWTLVSHSEMNFLRRHTCWQSKRLHWEGAPRRRAGGSGNPGGLLCHVAHSLGF